MNPRFLHNFAWIPPFLIGLAAVVLGITWMIVDEPWLLDQAANEATLQLSFEELFAGDENTHLPDYLTTIYRFFGLWVLGIGLLICAYVLVTFMGTPRSRATLLGVLGIFLILILCLAVTRIPLSPFVDLIYGMIFLYLVSLWASIKLNRVGN